MGATLPRGCDTILMSEGGAIVAHVDPFELGAIEQRARFVEQVTLMVGDSINPEILDAAFDVVPIGEEYGWVVVWEPYGEGDFYARWHAFKVGVWFSLWRARRQRAIMSFVLDVDQTARESCCIPGWGGFPLHEEEDLEPHPYDQDRE